MPAALTQVRRVAQMLIARSREHAPELVDLVLGGAADEGGEMGVDEQVAPRTGGAEARVAAEAVEGDDLGVRPDVLLEGLGLRGDALELASLDEHVFEGPIERRAGERRGLPAARRTGRVAEVLGEARRRASSVRQASMTARKVAGWP
jgi:hypothetical protein